MIAQHETIRQNDKPIRYAALIQCMAGIRDHVLARNKVLQWHGQQSQIHCPKFGSDRARGSWEFIEELIDELWCANNIPVTVYQL
jgi:hypothetical protein